MMKIVKKKNFEKRFLEWEKINQERFTLACDDTIEELQNMVQKIWTPAKVHRLFWLSVWKMWCEGKSKALEIEAHQLPEMNRLVLKKFYAEVKNKIHMFFRHFLHVNFIMFILLISNWSDVFSHSTWN